MKKIITCLLVVCIAFCALTFASCGFFEEEALVIESITAKTETDGSTKITISYVDNVAPPVEFYIPKGEKGDLGYGITEVKHSVDSDGNNVVTLVFDDEDIDDLTFTVKNGKTIESITDLEQEEITERYFFRINYNDGTSDIVYIPKGKDGNGIKDYVVEDVEGGGYKITFTFTDETFEPIVIDIPAPEKGETGVGIKENGVEAYMSEDGTKYVLKLSYTDGRTEEISFGRTNQWLSGNGKPKDSAGMPGDFYVDQQNDMIYFKDARRGWQVMFDLDGLQDEDCVVTFDLNAGGDENAKFPTNAATDEYVPSVYYIRPGHSFYSSSETIPVPTRDGYTFVGWYTEPSNISVVDGALNSLTTIVCDMTLYACWKANS